MSTFRTNEGALIHLYKTATSEGVIRTVLHADGPVELTMADAQGLAYLLLSRNIQIAATDLRTERTLSAPEVLAIAKERGAAFVTSRDRGLVSISNWLIYGKSPEDSCARFRETCANVFTDASRPDLLPEGWTFLTPGIASAVYGTIPYPAG